MIAPKVLPARAYAPIIRESGLLFHFSPAALDLKALTGEAAVFARAGVGGALVDRLGTLRVPVHSQPAFDFTDEDADNLFERPWAVIEAAGTQLVLRSEDFGTTWAVTGTPTRTAAALRLGASVLDLIGDNDAAAHEYYGQTVTFTGNAVKAISVKMAKGPSPAALGAMVWLRDTTGVADRLLARVMWNADGSPNVVMTTGTYLGAERLGIDGLGRIVYRLWFQSTTITAANTNNLRIGATQATVTEQGDVYAGCVQAENAEFPSSYLASLGTTVTRPVATLNYAIQLAAQALTAYGVVRPTYSLAVSPATERGWLGIGDDFTGEALHVSHDVSNQLAVYHGNGGGSVQAVVSLANLVAPIEYLAHLFPDGSVDAQVRDAAGTVRAGAQSAARAFVGATFQGGRLHIGARGTTLPGQGRFGAVKVAAGATKTLDAMVGAF